MMKPESKNIISDMHGRSTANFQTKGEHIPFGETTVEKVDYGNGSCSSTLCI